jgi:hypothetical protein
MLGFTANQGPFLKPPHLTISLKLALTFYLFQFLNPKYAWIALSRLFLINDGNYGKVV